jgi:hypothetical protein
MEREVVIFITVSIAALAAYITAKVTSRNQLKIAEVTAKKDLEIHLSSIRDAREQKEIALLRKKLESLHNILSKVSLENSLTVSFIQSDAKMPIEKFRSRYLDNCELFHKAQSISAIYYPEMTARLNEIYDASNVFWGHQEGVLRIDINENKAGWESNLEKVTSSSNLIADKVKDLKYDIREHGKALNKLLKQDS